MYIDYYQLMYKTSFYMVAATLSIAAMTFVFIEGWLDRRQTRVYVLMLFDVLLSSVGGIIYKTTQPFAIGNPKLKTFMLTFQFLDFLAHSALAPIFYLYIQTVIGAIHRRSLKKRVIIMMPFFVLEIMVMLNPILGWIYYFDEKFNFYRNWGESISYSVAALYFVLSAFDIFYYWHAVNKRRRLGLLYCFLITLTGIILQLLFINLSVELAAESIGLILLMLIVEREEDRLDQSTRTYNITAFQSDLNNFFRLGRNFYIVCVRILNSDILQRLTGSADDDALLREVVKYLREVHSKYQIYRVDESAFVLVCHGSSKEDANGLAERIRDHFSESIPCKDIDVRLKARILCVSVPEDLSSEKEIMMLIDSGKTAFVEYDPDDNRILQGNDIPKILYTASLEKALHRGLTEHNYEVHYQPVYSISDKSIFSAEASICLNDPEIGVVEAGKLLPLAEKQGVDVLISNKLLDEVCMFMGSGIPTELGLNQISVPISAKQCIQPYFIDMLDRLIREYNVTPSMINFEVPEPADANQYIQLEGVMRILREKGFLLSLDGYGVGYSSMKSFSNMGIDIVNINVNILGEREFGEMAKTMLKHNIRMLREMNMSVLIKQCSTPEFIEWVENSDASYIQSDYYSKIVTQNELISILRVTEIARQDEQRARAGREAKSNFLANMSHEIRTPINAILGMNEMILRESHNEAVLSYARDIENASRGLLSLINDILDFSKIEAGNMEIVPVEYDMSSLLCDIDNMVKIRIEQKGIEFNIDVDEELPEQLYGDEMRIRQVVLNILDNAIKFTEKGSISLSVRGVFSSDHSMRLVFEVSDTGCGLTAEEQEKIVTSFKDYDIRKTKTIGDKGLGLVITNKLLKLMDGTLQVESEYGKGSVFTAAIPQQVLDLHPIGDFRKRYQANTSSNSTYHEQFIAPTAHILVVDDTPINLTVVKSLLKKTRIDIDTATSGKEGLEKCASVPYDIIFLDYRMPEMDGVTTLKIMREMSDHPNKNTPIILLTANALSGAREQFLAAGFDDYMTKPIDGRKLEELLIRYLPKDKVILNAGGHADERSDEEEFLEKLNINAGLDTDQGLSNCGSVDGYREVIEIYLDSVEAKAAEIEKYYKEKDYENYTIQVHSLKSTSRVIGAVEIGELAAKLEQAGDKKNTEMINAETDILLNDIRELGRKLSDIMPGQDTVNEEELAEIDDSMLDDAYTTLSEFAAMMDYEDAGFVLDELKGYKLSDKEQERVNAIHNAVEKLDWDTVTKLISERGGR